MTRVLFLLLCVYYVFGSDIIIIINNNNIKLMNSSRHGSYSFPRTLFYQLPNAAARTVRTDYDLRRFEHTQYSGTPSYLRKGGAYAIMSICLSFCLSVCLFVCVQPHTKSYSCIYMKFLPKVGLSPD